MSDRIAIIDPDIRFAKCIEERLKKTFPSIPFRIYTPEDCRNKQIVFLDENMILYDNGSIDEEFLRSQIQDSSAKFIPLLADGFPVRKKDALELEACLSSIASGSDAYNTNRLAAIPASRDPNGDIHVIGRGNSGNSRMLVSLTDAASREAYVSSCAKSMMKTGQRLLRLDLMPGVSMKNQFRKRSEFRERSSISSTGISELLLKLESAKVTPDDLLQYVQLGIDGVYSFGIPDRSDDILDCHIDKLLHLLQLLRRLSDRKDQNFSVLVVLEGLSFHTLRSLCVVTEELHIIMPDESLSDRNLAEWEVHKLFSCLPPSMLKFISEPKRSKI